MSTTWWSTAIKPNSMLYTCRECLMEWEDTIWLWTPGSVSMANHNWNCRAISFEEIGHVADPDKVRAIKVMLVPQTVKSIRRFLRITDYYRTFMPDYAKLSEPLARFTKKCKRYRWGPEQQQNFMALRDQSKCRPKSCTSCLEPGHVANKSFNASFRDGIEWVNWLFNFP